MDNLRRAILVFTILLFATTSVFGYVLALDYYDESKSLLREVDYDGVPYNGEDTVISKEASKNLLVMIGDKGKRETELMFIVNQDADTKEMSFLYVPKYMKYSINRPEAKKTGAICQYYHQFGGEDLSILLSSLLNIEIDHYMYLTFDKCEYLVNRFTAAEQGVKFNFPVSVYCNDPYINISAGTQYFDGEGAVKIMRYYKSASDEYNAAMIKYYDGTDLKRIKMVKSFANAFICGQFTDEKANSRYINDFVSAFTQEVIGKCDTNIDETFLKNVVDTLKDVPSSALRYHVLDCVSASDVQLQNYTGLIEDITSENRDSHTKLSADKSAECLKTYY